MIVFEYDLSDLSILNELETTNESNSTEFQWATSFDSTLLIEWRKAMQNGLFRFKIGDKDGDPVPTRYLPGRYSFLLQLNPKRFSEKRPTDMKSQTPELNLPYDASKFNFTKINRKEILIKMVKKDNESLSPESGDLSGNFLTINNSPIELGHILIIPKLNSGLNQVLTAEAVELAVEVSLLTGSNNLIVGFNSVGAFSSVNHLHVQGYYLNSSFFRDVDPLPIHTVKLAEKLAPCLWFLDDTELYFMHTIGLQLCDFNNDIKLLSDKVFQVTNYLSKRNIPHNMLIVKCEPFVEYNSLSQTIENGVHRELTIRVVIWPKKHTREIPPNEKNLNFAMCEFAGHLILSDQETYDGLTEEYILESINDCKLSSDQIEEIKRDLQRLMI